MWTSCPEESVLRGVLFVLLHEPPEALAIRLRRKGLGRGGPGGLPGVARVSLQALLLGSRWGGPGRRDAVRAPHCEEGEERLLCAVSLVLTGKP